LICGEHTLNAFLPTRVNSRCNTDSRFFFRRIGGASRKTTADRVPAVSTLDPRAIERLPSIRLRSSKSCPHEPLIVAHRTAELAPAVGADAFVVMDLACRGVCRRARKMRKPHFLTTDQPLYNTRRDRSGAASVFLFSWSNSCARAKLSSLNKRRHRDLDPLPRVDAHDRRSRLRRSRRGGALSVSLERGRRREFLPNAAAPAIGRIMEDCPYGRALPSGSVFARRRLLRIESTRDLAKTQILNDVHLVDLFYYVRFSVKTLDKNAGASSVLRTYRYP